MQTHPSQHVNSFLFIHLFDSFDYTLRSTKNCFIFPSGCRPPAHSDRRHSDSFGAASADSHCDLPVPAANRRISGFLRGGALQPHQLRPRRASREEHPGVRHGAERAAGVTLDRPWTGLDPT